MTEVESRSFRALDDYARSRHQCFLAEFFADQQGVEYSLCFRPANVDRKSEKRYACKYTRITFEEMTTTGVDDQLSAALRTKLDYELSGLAEKS